MSKKGGTTTTSNTPTLDPASQAYMNAYRTAATANAGQAGQTADQLTAAGQQLTGGIPYAMQTGLGGIDAYMNPYQNDVIAGVNADTQHQLGVAGVQAGDLATKAGAFGGDRSAVLQANMSSDINRNSLNTLANVRSSGFENAVQQLMQSRQMQGQYGLAGLGIMGQAQGMRQSALQPLAAGVGPYGMTTSTSTPGDPWGFWGGLAGTVGGAMIGGPAGAAVGGKIGGSI